MDDLLQPQIRDSCRLALPEGLKDLMSDISREVLRAQPKNLLKFITDYLSALLVTREHLTIAATVCDDICNHVCAVGLEDELLEMGIHEDDVPIVKKLVDRHFEKLAAGVPIKKGNLISKIMRKTSVDLEQIADIQEAIRKSFLRHQMYRTTIYEMTPHSSMDDIKRATLHTLDLFRKTPHTEEEYSAAATKITAAYRAYGVRRQMSTEQKTMDWSYAPELLERAELAEKDIKRRITFQADGDVVADTIHYAEDQYASSATSDQTDDRGFFVSESNQLVDIASSSSLAGSFVKLPKYKPYNVHESPLKEADELDEDAEVEKQKTEHLNIDYTRETSKQIDIEIPEEIVPQGDYEPDDIDSSIEEEEVLDKKVVIVSNSNIQGDDDNDDSDD